MSEDMFRKSLSGECDIIPFTFIADGHLKLQEEAKAVELYKKIISCGEFGLQTSEEKAAYVCAYNNLSLLGTKNALIYIDKAIELDAKNPFLFFNKAYIYFKMKEYDKALIECDKSLSINSKIIKSYKLKAVIYTILKNESESTKMINYGLENFKGSHSDFVQINHSPILLDYLGAYSTTIFENMEDKIKILESELDELIQQRK